LIHEIRVLGGRTTTTPDGLYIVSLDGEIGNIAIFKIAKKRMHHDDSITRYRAIFTETYLH